MSSRLPNDLSRFPTLTLVEARQLTGLDLVAARDVKAEDGSSYHDMETQTESKSHDRVRGEGIGFFVSIGYRVFPEGVGVRGTYTLADFLAVRDGRIVFVEVLSDSNIKQETLQRKAQLQAHGELCFLLFSGTKRSDDAALLAAKRAIEDWADVLYCRLNGYSGNFIDHDGRTAVEYDTTRAKGIRVALSFEKSGRKLGVAVKFLTHLYDHPMNTPLMYSILPISYRYEHTFLSVFQRLERLDSWKIKYTSRSEKVIIRATRRKAGLKLRWPDQVVAACYRSEYRGEPREETGMETYHPSSRELPPEHVYGVYILEKTGPTGLHNLLAAMKECRLSPIYDADELQAALNFLQKQAVPTLESKEKEAAR